MRNQTATLRSTRAAPRSGARKPSAEPAAEPVTGGEALGLSPGPALLEGPSREELVRFRAYERYERNGCVDGHDVDDWLAAEAEVGAVMTEAASHLAMAGA